MPMPHGEAVGGPKGRAYLSQEERDAGCPAWPDLSDWAELEHGKERPSPMRETSPSSGSPGRVQREMGKSVERHKAQLSLSPRAQRGSERTR